MSIRRRLACFSLASLTAVVPACSDDDAASAAGPSVDAGDAGAVDAADASETSTPDAADATDEAVEAASDATDDVTADVATEAAPEAAATCDAVEMLGPTATFAADDTTYHATGGTLVSGVFDLQQAFTEGLYPQGKHIQATLVLAVDPGAGATQSGRVASTTSSDAFSASLVTTAVHASFTTTAAGRIEFQTDAACSAQFLPMGYSVTTSNGQPAIWLYDAGYTSAVLYEQRPGAVVPTP